MPYVGEDVCFHFDRETPGGACPRCGETESAAFIGSNTFDAVRAFPTREVVAASREALEGHDGLNGFIAGDLPRLSSPPPATAWSTFDMRPSQPLPSQLLPELPLLSHLPSDIVKDLQVAPRPLTPGEEAALAAREADHRATMEALAPQPPLDEDPAAAWESATDEWP